MLNMRRYFAVDDPVIMPLEGVVWGAAFTVPAAVICAFTAYDLSDAWPYAFGLGFFASAVLTISLRIREVRAKDKIFKRHYTEKEYSEKISR